MSTTEKYTECSQSLFSLRGQAVNLLWLASLKRQFNLFKNVL